MNQTLMTWGAIIASAMAGLGFLAALAVAYLTHDQSNVTLLIGAIVSNFSSAISFWLGSSAGSQKKDEALFRSDEIRDGGARPVQR